MFSGTCSYKSRFLILSNQIIKVFKMPHNFFFVIKTRLAAMNATSSLTV